MNAPVVVETSDDEERQAGHAFILAPDSQPEPVSLHGAQAPHHLKDEQAPSSSQTAPLEDDEADAPASSASSERTVALSSQDMHFADITTSTAVTSPIAALVEAESKRVLSPGPASPSRDAPPAHPLADAPVASSARSAPVADGSRKRRKLDAPLREPNRSSPPRAIAGASMPAAQPADAESDDEMDLLASQRHKDDQFARMWAERHAQDLQNAQNAAINEAAREALPPTITSSAAAPRTTGAHEAVNDSGSADGVDARVSAMEIPEATAEAGPSKPPAFRLVSSPAPSDASSALSDPPSPTMSRSPLAPLSPAKSRADLSSLDADQPSPQLASTAAPDRGQMSPLESGAPTLSPPAAPADEAPATPEANSTAPVNVADEIPAELLLPSPPRAPVRQLRERKAAQLKPFTHEQLLYQKVMLSRNWEGAIISRKEVLREEKQRTREEESKDAKQAGTQGEAEWLVPDPEKEARRLARRQEAEERERARQAHEAAHPHTTSSPTSVTANSNAKRKGKQRAVSPQHGTPSGAESVASIRSVEPPKKKKRTKRTTFDLQAAGRALSDADSDEEEGEKARDAQARLSRQPAGRRRAKRRAPPPSDSETDDEAQLRRQYKMLKKMYPKATVEKFMADVRAMRKGKQYHSDGHYSSTPDPSENEAPPRRKRPEKLSSSQSEDDKGDEVAPGVARKKNAYRGDASEGRFDLVGDSESEPGGSNHERVMFSSSDGGLDDAEVVWVGARQRGERQQSEDMIDRMLSRAEKPSKARRGGAKRGAGGRSRRTESGAPRGKTSSKSAHTAVGASRGATVHPLPVAEPLSSEESYASDSADRRTARRTWDPSRPKAPAKHNDRPRFRQFRRARRAGFNPPVVHPRERRLLDREMDDRLFEDAIHDAAPIPDDAGAAKAFRLADEGSATELERRQPARPVQQQAGPSAGRVTFAQRQQHARTFAKTTSFSRIPEAAAPAPVVVAALPDPVADQQVLAQAELWAQVGEVRLDLGIPAALHDARLCDRNLIKRGELRRLLGALQPNTTVDTSSVHFGLDFAIADADQILRSLPAFFDAVRRKCEIVSAGDGPGEVDEVLAALRALCDALYGHAGDASSIAALESVAARLEQLCERTPHAMPPKTPLARLQLGLAWLRLTITIVWQKVARAAPPNTMDILSEPPDVAPAAEALMLRLLKYGLHNTMRSIKEALPHEEQITQIIKDETVDLWRALIALLGDTFWPTFEDAFMPWLDRLPPSPQPHTRGERIWFAVFSLNAIATIPLDEQVPNQLSAHWPLVAGALNSACVRYDEGIESDMSEFALGFRDLYIQTVLRRIGILCSAQDWQLWSAASKDGENLLRQASRAIFDAKGYYFQSLPSEEGHDFPLFLRIFDDSLLDDDEGRTDNAFHIYLKLLVRYAREAQDAGPASSDRVRETSRFFHRLLPVQKTKFNADDTPTKLELSRLYNLYSLATVTLYMAPDPSEARWQMRRVQGWLDFAQADNDAQLVCIRAVQYLGVVCQHHRLGLDDVVGWFEDLIKRLQHALLLTNNGTTGDYTTDRLRKKQRVRHRDLLKAALRAVRNVIQHPSLNRHVEPKQLPFPSKQLLSAVWTDQLLSSPVVAEASIALEAVACMQAFLARRLQLSESLTTGADASTTAAADADESQEMWQDLWNVDDADLDVAMLEAEANLAVDVPPQQASASASTTLTPDAFAQQDRELAQSSVERLVGMLFHVVSTQLTSDASGAHAVLTIDEEAAAQILRAQGVDGLSKLSVRKVLLEQLIDSWAGCAHVLVQNNVHGWDAFIGAWKPTSVYRLPSSPVARDAVLRFALNMVDLDPTVVKAHAPDLLKTWYRCVGARRLTVQAPFTRTLAAADPPVTFFRGVAALLESGGGGSSSLGGGDTQPTQPQAATQATRARFADTRAAVVRQTLRNMREDGLATSSNKRLMLESLPHLLSSLSEEVEAMTQSRQAGQQQQQQQRSEEDTRYLAFVREVADGFADDVGSDIFESGWFALIKQKLSDVQAKMREA